MPDLLKCVLEIENRCKNKGSVVIIDKEILLAMKYYLCLLKELSDEAVNYLGTTLECLDLVDKATIKSIAEETW